MNSKARPGNSQMADIHLPLVPIITKEIHYDQLTPILVYTALGGVGATMFESAHDEGYGLYSYIGINPLATFSAIGSDVTIDLQGAITKFTADPYKALSQFAYKRKAFGFITYDAVRLKEQLPDRHQKLSPLPDFLFHVYKTVIKFEHKMHKLIMMHEGTVDELEAIIKQINQGITLQNPIIGVAVAPHSQEDLAITSDVSDEQYIAMVKQAQEYIKAGDIFQVVLSRTFTAQVNQASALDIYRALRRTNPTPYLAFFQEKDYAIASASPELLVGVKDGIIETVPIAGTCRIEDDIDDLLNDPKENAEHVMLVDLARNDIGVVATPGSVKITEYKGIKTLTHIVHIVSKIVGKLSQKFTPLDALQAVLPAGTLSGAPKIRAMEIIDELEHSRRGLYGGAIMLIDEDSNITSAIEIRTAVVYPDKVDIRTGAGIVLDSVPEKEVLETKLKAQGVIKALQLAQEGYKS